MGKPRMIILIRHAQSEGNKNRDIHQTIPDHRVKLTPEGWTQAHDAGRRLRSLLRADDTLHFFTSPYRRTRETTEGILSTLTSDEPSPSPFPRHSIKVYEEPRLREQDFGNFQPCSAEMERMWQERADYGHFFYRIPNGESAADAYDRISGFNESLWRQFGEDDCASVVVLITHGLMSRVFLMKWYHFSVEYFEDLRNVNHCEFLIMRQKENSGKYILENNLRTWSELKRERLAALKEREKANPKPEPSEKDKEKEKRLALPTIPSSPTVDGIAQAGSTTTSIPVRKRWGGCPNGCDHGTHYYKKENSMHAMQLNGKLSTSNTPSQSTTTSPITSTNESFPPTTNLALRRPAASRRWQSSSEEDEDDVRGRVGPPFAVDVQKAHDRERNTTDLKKSTSTGAPSTTGTSTSPGDDDDTISSPDGTPSFISVDDRLRNHIVSPKSKLSPDSIPLRVVGRDFGGSASGKSSRAGSDAEFSAEEDVKKRATRRDGKEDVGIESLMMSSVGGRFGSGGSSGNANGVGNGQERRTRKSRDPSGMRSGAMADALGDQSDTGSDGGSNADMEDLKREEKRDRSVRGSVL